MIEQAIENTWAVLLFFWVLLGVLAVALLAVLFAGLAISCGWRWLRSHSWNSVVILTEKGVLGKCFHR